MILGVSGMSSGNDICGGLLSEQEIQNHQLIQQISSNCLQTASYDLTVGDRHFLYAESGSWQAVFLGSVDDLKTANAEIDPGSPLLLSHPAHGGNRLVIPAFGSAVVQLAETVDLYTVAEKESLLVAGRFDLKLKAIYKGLISQQATQVEPCYQGKLYCFLHNLGTQEIVLEKGEKLVTIEFSYVGQQLEEHERKQIIASTIAKNKQKYVKSRFADERGITDIRWLHECGMLPKACGIAPIYRLVHHNVGKAVEKHLETSDVVEKLAERVDSKMSEKQSAIKIVLALITAVITFFAGGFLIDVMAELRYFREELAFFAESTVQNQASLQAIQAHTEKLAEQRFFILGCSIACISVIVVLLLVLFWRFLGPQYEQKWERKQKAREAKRRYRQSGMSDDELAQIVSNFKAAQAKIEVATGAYESGLIKLEKAKADFRKWRKSFRRERNQPPDGGST